MRRARMKTSRSPRTLVGLSKMSLLAWVMWRRRVTWTQMCKESISWVALRALVFNNNFNSRWHQTLYSIRRWIWWQTMPTCSTLPISCMISFPFLITHLSCRKQEVIQAHISSSPTLRVTIRMTYRIMTLELNKSTFLDKNNRIMKSRNANRSTIHIRNHLMMIWYNLEKYQNFLMKMKKWMIWLTCGQSLNKCRHHSRHQTHFTNKS